MSIEQIQQDMKNLQAGYKKLVIWVIIILLLIILVFVVWLNAQKVHTAADIHVQALTDSMRVHDRQRDSMYTNLQNRVTQDSIRYSSLQQQVSNVPNMIAAINKRYDDKRTILNNSTPDEQFGFFSDWLSQADTL